MPLWNRLYNAVWLAFLCCVMLPRWMGPLAGAITHVLLGLGMLALAVSNARRLAALPVPARLKRISKATAGFAGVQAVVGVAFGGVIHALPGLPVVGTVLQVVHVICAGAILAQTASVATAYDMWEEKEFTEAKAPAGTDPA